MHITTSTDLSDIEHLVLSGKLFSTNTDSCSSSPERSPSPTLAFASASTSSDTSHHHSHSDGSHQQQQQYQQQELIGMGPGRTGVKGVIHDSHEAAALKASRRAHEMDEVRRRMEKAHLGGKTFLEEEAEALKATVSSIAFIPFLACRILLQRDNRYI
ncbi:hypothetical protein CY34DRAFT_18765 [Suillus luteus UH-Slu-Lm8-n1]|uniref:Uncharacterized protein n=1 Tax=Suillus luteus UH-Slu-Lm8-n1 TaxID=930992 RepID=A0A0D0AF62_9AGAM|nr:hypothetical protein CY34DRAFT_18765 [Suillus luteus UH-Slu-Lm8-n1]